MDEDLKRDTEAMEPDIEDLAERVERLEYEIGDGADALAKIKELERKLALMAEEISRLSGAPS